MADLIELSTRINETGDLTTRTNRTTGELSELADGLAVVESFSHVWAVDTGDGLVLVDTSQLPSARSSRQPAARKNARALVPKFGRAICPSAPPNSQVPLQFVWNGAHTNLQL